MIEFAHFICYLITFIHAIGEARMRRKLLLLSAQSDREYSNYLHSQILHMRQHESTMPQVKDLLERADPFEEMANY